MCARTLTALLSMLLVGCAAASPIKRPARRVLCYGDPITQGASFTENWPRRLADARPDLDVSNAGLLGDTSDNVDRFEESLAKGPYDWVVILIGVNDLPSGRSSDPETTVRRILRLARMARTRDAEVIILTLLPVSDRPLLQSNVDLQDFTRTVSRGLLDAYPHPRGGIRVANLRDRFTLVGIDDTSDDGLHPNAVGNALIAEFVSDQIPRTTVVRSPALR